MVTMRVAAGQYFELTEDNLSFVTQLGLRGVCFVLPKTPDDRLDYTDFAGFASLLRQHGLSLEAVEQVPIPLYDKAMLGLDGRDAQIENYQRILRDLGRAEVPILGLHWMANFVWRNGMKAGRGGAQVSYFDLDTVSRERTHGAEYSAEDMWDNFTYFMDAVLPVAEQAGVRIALHPDDPPVGELGGVGRAFATFEQFQRATERYPSRHFSLLFCMGTWSEMGPGLVAKLRYFAERDRIAYVHFRDVKGYVPRFEECFIDEGNVDVVAAIRTLHETKFEGFLIDDHVPRMLGDTDYWCHRGRSFATGFISGLLRAVSAGAGS